MVIPTQSQLHTYPIKQQKRASEIGMLKSTLSNIQVIAFG